MKANTSTNAKFYENQLTTNNERGSKEWYEDLIKMGYTHLYRWVNSDENWEFFANNSARAVQGAIELYMTEKNKDLKTAKSYYSEYVDVIEISEHIKNAF